MTGSDYRIAELDQADIETLRQFERQLSERSGQAITLIAYEQDESGGDGAIEGR